jgi:hypothetical protein
MFAAPLVTAMMPSLAAASPTLHADLLPKP